MIVVMKKKLILVFLDSLTDSMSHDNRYSKTSVIDLGLSENELNECGYISANGRLIFKCVVCQSVPN